MSEYVRNSHCECKDYIDIDQMDVKSRVSSNKYWQNGYICENGRSYECTCHKKFRLKGRYERLAEEFNLPSYEELKQQEFIGDNTEFLKLKKLPKLVEDKQLRNVVCFVHGAEQHQKTTSAAKVIFSLVTDGRSVNYINFIDLIEKLNNKEPIEALDWLIIDDCFADSTTSFKTPYNAFYNMILKRSKPTILISDFEREDILSRKDRPYYNLNLMTKLFNKIDQYNTDLPFTQSVNNEENQLLSQGKNGKIDIWSL